MDAVRIVKVLEGNPELERRFIVQTEDGRRFCAKSHKCAKRQDTMNSVWLANEVVYYGFARSAGLRIPDAALLLWDDDILYGSEMCDGRDVLRNEAALVSLAESCTENRLQLAKALLLDLALLNSDRVLSAILVDARGNLWFIDHDKSLWGDGMEQHNNTSRPGDLWRIDTSNLPDQTDNFIRNYLHLKTAGVIVWNLDWATITEVFESLPLNQDTFYSSCSEVPKEWLGQDLVDRMVEFLGLWWDELSRLFDQGDSQERVKQLLSV